MNDKQTRVLIADQVEHIRSALRLVLRQDPDVTVVGEAADAERAVAEAQARRPDLVLVEWDLPGQHGSSIVADLKRAQPGLRVIATSARIEARRAALAAGADSFVSKLDPPERLLRAVHDRAGKNGRSGIEKGEATR